MATTAADAALIFPCPIIVDTREQTPFAFVGMRADANQQYLPFTITTQPGALASGDYSLLGFENQVSVERKSLADLFNTIGQGRQLFEKELQRLAAYPFAAVVCEADWNTIVTSPPSRSQLRPKTVFRSVIAWQMRYSRIHWWMCPGRSFAERVTFRILERFLKLHQPKAAPNASKN